MFEKATFFGWNVDLCGARVNMNFRVRVCQTSALSNMFCPLRQINDSFSVE